jgi:hypothetical protein
MVICKNFDGHNSVQKGLARYTSPMPDHCEPHQELLITLAGVAPHKLDEKNGVRAYFRHKLSIVSSDPDFPLLNASPARIVRWKNESAATY